MVSVNRLREKYGEEFERLNGFHNENLNFTDFIDHFIDSDNVANATIDGNANANTKDICSLMAEIDKPHTKLLAYNKIFYELTKKYGLKTAEEWLEQEWSGGFYLHDAPTSSFKSYCLAYDLDELVEKGLFFVNDFKSEAPKHLMTFVRDVLEFVSWTSNRTSGACGLPSFLIYSFYYWKKDVEDGYYLRSPEYYRDQGFQEIIYGLNQPYLRVNQSAFTNFTIMDRPYLMEMFGGREYPDGTFVIDYIEELIEYQKAFMEEVSRTREKTMFTFPVLTYSLLYKDGKFVDEEFARWCNRHNMKWCDSNFFISEDVTSLSSCCFDGKQMCLARFDGEVKLVPFKELYDLAEQAGHYDVDVYHYGRWEPGKIVRLPARKMYQITTTKGHALYVTDNHVFMTPTRDVQAHNIVPGDLLVMNNHFPAEDDITEDIVDRMKDLGCWCGTEEELQDMLSCVEVESVEAYEYADEFTYCFEMGDESEPYFTLPNGIISHNCRLVNDFTKLNGFINSIGGTALKIGSVKVNTINLVRIAIEAGKENGVDAYLSLLKERVDVCMKTLDVIRGIIARNIEKGLLPNYTYKLIELKNQYNTIGINGMFEAVELFGGIEVDEFGNHSYTEAGLQMAIRILDTINECKDAFQKDYSINVEAVPAERCAAVLYQKDKLLNPWLPERTMYGNQWCPLDQKCTLNEKIRLGAVLDKKCGGGQIMHVNIQGPFATEEQAWDLLNHIAQSGVIYFAYNLKIAVCEEGHGFVGKYCPTCGGEVVDTYQRVVGFLTPSHSYSKERKTEFANRYWYDLND